MTALIIIVVVVLVVLVALFWTGTQQQAKRKNEWAAGAKPADLDWELLLSSEIQVCLPRNKIEAIKRYREHTGVGLAEAKEAVEYAMAYPDRAPATLIHANPAEVYKSKVDESGMDWDLLLSDEMQMLLPDKKIDAIKLYRERTNLGLKEAKDAIDEYLLNPEAVPAKIRRYDLMAQQSDGIRDLLLEGKRDEARKTYQAFTGVDQFTANEAIDALEEEVRASAGLDARMQSPDSQTLPSDDTYDEEQKRRPT